MRTIGITFAALLCVGSFASSGAAQDEPAAAGGAAGAADPPAPVPTSPPSAAPTPVDPSGTRIASQPVPPPPVPAPAGGGESTAGSCTLWSALQTRMRLALEELGIDADDTRQITAHHVENAPLATNEVVLFVNAELEPYFPLPDTIDERDVVYVVAVDEEKKIAADQDEGKVRTRTKITRCKRVPLAPRVLGSLAGGPTGADSKATACVPPAVAHRTLVVGPCAGSDSEAEQPKITLERSKRSDRTLTYPVNQIFSLSIGLGLGYDDTTRRTLRARTRPGDTVPTIAEETDHEGLTALAAISWYPFGRDFRKRAIFWDSALERSILFVGIDVASIGENLMLGVGYELFFGLNALAGWRVLTRNPVLAEGSGLDVGDTFDSTRGDLPTRERWETGSFFVGVSATDDLLRSIGARE